MKAKSRMFLAAAKQGLGQNDSALMMIRGLPDMVKPIVRNTALSYAIGIYLDAGITDTAFIYAKQLVESPDFSNKKSGYLALLSPSLLRYSSIDSLRSYSYSYGRALEKTLNDNENQLAINQQSIYNYQLHERIKAETEKDNRRLTTYIYLAILLSLILGILVLTLKVKNDKNVIRLRSELENIHQLEQIINLKNNSPNDLSQHTLEPLLKPDNPNESADELRSRLRIRLLALYNDHKEPRTLDLQIIESDAYKKMQEYLKNQKEIKDGDPLWDQLESVVLACSPKFKDNLQLLVSGRMNSYDLHTSLLIRCGVSPSQMAVLLNRTKGTIVSRRESLCMRVFDEKLGTKVIDGIIRLL